MNFENKYKHCNILNKKIDELKKYIPKYHERESRNWVRIDNKSCNNGR